jgi:hypothetical protein
MVVIIEERDGDSAKRENGDVAHSPFADSPFHFLR